MTSGAARIYLSPAAIDYIPILILHGVSLAYLLVQRPKTRQTWLFCGWLGGMTLMTATQCAARFVYTMPYVSSYLNWWGGIAGVTLAMIALLQFAYYFPRLRYPREAKVVLILSIVITAVLWGWTAWESATSWAHRMQATSPPRPGVVLTREATWLIYDFERFLFGFAQMRDAGFWVSFKFFDRWQVIGNLWIFLIWVRKTIQFSKASEGCSFMRRATNALCYPQGREARLSRAWMLLMLLAPLTVVASALDAGSQLPPGLFAAINLLVFFAIILTYVNYAPEPTTMMVKLIGISLVTLLVMLGLISGYALQAYRQAYTQVRRAELDHIRSLIADENFTDVPAEALYIASRPVQGLFAAVYQLPFTRLRALDAAQFAAHDALLREGLVRDHFATFYTVNHEHPWIGYAGMCALAGNAQAIDTLFIPETVTFYRGSASSLAEHILRYTFVEGDVRYEVGYSYPAYRLYLHKRALPLLWLMLGTTFVILLVFPRFFHVGLVAPLARLLDGVDRVDQGELRGDIPIYMEDEIGRLTHAFNHMVRSLKTSREDLRALNVTLEQRVVDRTRDLATLYEIAALVSRTSALKTLLTAVLPRIVSGVDADAGLILVMAHETDQFHAVAIHNLSPELSSWVGSPSVLEMIQAQAAPLLIHDLATDPRTALLLGTDMFSELHFPYRTMASLPIHGQEDILGVLVVFGAQSLLFNVEDVEVLSSVAEQLGVAIENVRLREQVVAAAAWEERQRLARDLHDSVTQILYSQTLFADAASKSLDTHQLEETSHYLMRLGESARRALREMRLMIYRLRPSVLEQRGLVGALQRRLDMVERRAGVRVHFLCEALPPLPEEREMALYYVAEEALNNALKHASASEVQVTLARADAHVLLRVVDNGVGFDPAKIATGLGLHSMRERVEALGGELTIVSSPGEGARVEAHLPLSTD